LEKRSPDALITVASGLNSEHRRYLSESYSLLFGHPLSDALKKDLSESSGRTAKAALLDLSRKNVDDMIALVDYICDGSKERDVRNDCHIKMLHFLSQLSAEQREGIVKYCPELIEKLQAIIRPLDRFSAEAATNVIGVISGIPSLAVERARDSVERADVKGFMEAIQYFDGVPLPIEKVKLLEKHFAECYGVSIEQLIKETGNGATESKIAALDNISQLFQVARSGN
jgi:hypothetical protein